MARHKPWLALIQQMKSNPISRPRPSILLWLGPTGRFRMPVAWLSTGAVPPI